MYIFLAAVAVILIIIFIFVVNKKEFYKLKRNLEFAFSLPGAPIFLSVVNSLQIALNYKKLLDCVDSTTKKYGNITRFILGTDVVVVLSKPEDYKLVLTNVNGTYKTSVTKTWEVIIGDGIVRTSGATHKLRRKIIHPLLNLKYLSKYATFFDNFSNLCADAIEKNVDGQMFDLKPHIMQYTFDIFLASVVGIQKTAYKDGNELLHLQKKLFEHSYSRVIKPWLQLEWIMGQRYVLLSVATIVVNLIRRFRFMTTGSVDDIKVTADFLFRARDVKMSISRV
ncbi:PREDICTED: cytochrome P450 4d2-like [Wasmannia auropunctata]|uniref:cytochrome P450 4d2-like n=1 Tax=Wasmannia auropunctata TaxID=64793 RepID=UPI0005EEF109|nr:PREDICTED: cytochrome P450 4d2-like [Wasmannia auropunctata]